MEFLLDGVVQSTDSSSAYEWSWNTAASTKGAHVLAAKAYDCANVTSSVEVMVTVDQPPSTPEVLSALSTTRKIVSLTWTASTDDNAVTLYEVWRATTASGPFVLIGTSTTLGYSDTTVASRTTYHYFVKARDASGNLSAPTYTVSITAK